MGIFTPAQPQAKSIIDDISSLGNSCNTNSISLDEFESVNARNVTGFALQTPLTAAPGERALRDTENRCAAWLAQLPMRLPIQNLLPPAAGADEFAVRHVLPETQDIDFSPRCAVSALSIAAIHVNVNLSESILEIEVVVVDVSLLAPSAMLWCDARNLREIGKLKSTPIQIAAPNVSIQLDENLPEIILAVDVVAVDVSLLAPPAMLWCDARNLREIGRLKTTPTQIAAPISSETESLSMDVLSSELHWENLTIAPPATRGRVFVRFAPIPLGDASENARREASRVRPPDDDPFSALFYLLLAKHNWDVRVIGLDSLLAAYPPGKTPFPFQYEGINFLAKRSAALLSDEMGLGKTIQAILAMRARIHCGDFQRVLVVCPKSLLANWLIEISTWAPELSARIVHGVDRAFAIRTHHHVYITNFETVASSFCFGNEGSQHRTIKPFDLMVVDEAQNLKNPSTVRAKAVANVQATNRWALTGTPLENKFADYRAIWKILAPDAKLNQLSNADFLATTKTNVLRREKKAVLRDLPDQIVREQFVDLEGKQRANYQALEAESQRDARSKYGMEESKLRAHILTLLNDLKQACIIDYKSGESVKMEWLEELLDEMHPEGVPHSACEKALVFTQYPKLVYDTWNLPDRPALSNYRPVRYDSSLTKDQRERFTSTFQKDETKRVAFMGVKSGGVGLTLTRASQVVFLDQWWNPAVMDQAAARVHRIGQKRTCVITTLVARHTVEERIMQILRRKKDLFDRTMAEISSGKQGEVDFESMENALTLDDLLEALGLDRRRSIKSGN